MIELAQSDKARAKPHGLANAEWPFLRWAGGKRWLLPHLKPIADALRYRLYIEPFLGGGAIFFGLQPKRALLADVNAELIATYAAVRDFPDLVLAGLKHLSVDEDTYKKLRKNRPSDRLGRATRMIYLNRTGFSGIYRVNRKGEYNVPYGGGDRTPNFLWESGILLRASKRLEAARFVGWDFERTMKHARSGSLVYCDPTYTALASGDMFRRYHHAVFGWEDQERLHKAAAEAHKRGAVVIVSNADLPEVRSLYNGHVGKVVDRRSTVSRIATRRQNTTELVVVMAQPRAKARLLASNLGLERL